MDGKNHSPLPKYSEALGNIGKVINMVLTISANILSKKSFWKNHSTTAARRYPIFSYLLIPQILKFTNTILRLVVFTNLAINLYFKTCS